jgi:hypothetical protein
MCVDEADLRRDACIRCLRAPGDAPGRRESRGKILAAAQAENRLPEADIQAYLNGKGDPEAPSPFDVLGVHVVEFGTNASNCFILASYYTRTQGTDPFGASRCRPSLRGSRSPGA